MADEEMAKVAASTIGEWSGEWVQRLAECVLLLSGGVEQDAGSKRATDGRQGTTQSRSPLSRLSVASQSPLNHLLPAVRHNCSNG